MGSNAAETTEATALMAMLAAANDDPLAPRFWSYVEANPDADATYALQAVGFVTRMLDHTLPRRRRPSHTRVAGPGPRSRLKPGEAFHLTVGSQLADFTVEPVTGRIAVTTSWREPVEPASYEGSRMSRSSGPSAPPGRRHGRDRRRRLGRRIRPLVECRLPIVTDLVPSGLVSVGKLQRLGGPRGRRRAPGRANAVEPYARMGQRVDFCAEPRAGGKVKLHYLARVVTTGELYLGDGDRAVASRTGAGGRLSAPRIRIH